MSEKLKAEVQRRRTFAIISHPDAGKTTLTEKLLLYGGAIHLAGAVKAKASQRKATSDWMEIEKQRGISVSTSVLQFEYDGYHINLLDTPGHKDFSEDTYRTLVAADAAVMLIDASKGVEPQTRKLFEVCRMRGLPIFTFINKMDRPCRDPFDLIDELEKVLNIRSCPMNWPVGQGPTFRGVYDRHKKFFHLFEKQESANVKKRVEPVHIEEVSDPKLLELLSWDNPQEATELRDELQTQLELVAVAGDPFDLNKVLHGQLSPLFFGSAMNNFGVENFLQHFLAIAPPPAPRKTQKQIVDPVETKFSGLFFKIQANMDPQHRDRVAFLRICSGLFQRNMMVSHLRTGKKVKLSQPLNFFAQERVLVDEAWAGDIVGLVDTSGDFRIGDTLAEEDIGSFEGVPRFSPEHFMAVRSFDPLKRKQLKKGLEQLSEEGVVQLFYKPNQGEQNPVLGAVGVLQFEVMQHRLKAEYNVEMKMERLPFVRARWVKGEGDLNEFNQYSDCCYLVDRDQKPVVLFKSEWGLNWALGKFPGLEFMSFAT